MQTDIASVPDGDAKEVESLKQDLLQSAERRFDEACLNVMNLETAQTYSYNRPCWQTMTYHLQSVSCGTTNWRRQDKRVSKEILKASFSFKTASQTLDVIRKEGPLQTKLSIPFHHFVALRLNENTDTLAAHVCQPPQVVEKRDGESQWQVLEGGNHGGVTSLSLRLVEEKYDLTELRDNFAQNSFLQHAMGTRINLNRSYPDFRLVKKVEDHFTSFPILKDPTLVRAAQMAVLELLEQAKIRQNDLKWLIKQFHGIQITFRQLLQQRLDVRRHLAPEE